MSFSIASLFTLNPFFFDPFYLLSLMPRILTKAAADEVLATPLINYTRRSVSGGSSTRKRKSMKIIKTERSLRNLVIEVDGYVLNDDNGICPITLERMDPTVDELMRQLESIQFKLREIAASPTDFGLSAKKVRKGRISAQPAAPSVPSPALKHAKTHQTPHRLIMDEIETSPMLSTPATPVQTNARPERTLFESPPQSAGRKSARKSIDYREHEALDDVSKSPSLFAKIKNRLSFGLFD